MPRYRKMLERDDGWCDWVAPIMSNYKMACCHCGLVHDVQFDVVRQGRVREDGSWRAHDVKGKYRVLLRARRNNRSTAQVRRHSR